jgi:hypothetical protein
MARAAQALEAKYASPNVADWKWAIAEEDIRHSAAGVTSVPAIHWVNRPTFQQVVQVGVDVPVSRGFGAGALTGAGGKKIGFAFDVQELIGGGAEGRFLLHDFKTKKTVDMQEISNAGSPAGDGCGSISSGAPDSFEFTGTGRFNGSGSHTVHVCIQDNADPGDGADRLHVECATCPYNTTTAAASEALTFGNIDVAGADEAPPPPGTPQVVVLGPVLGAIGSLGAPLTLTATAYDAEGNPVPGMALSFLAGAPLNLSPLAAITDSEGQLIFTAAALLPVDTEIRAVAAGTHSNPVQLSWK